MGTAIVVTGSKGRMGQAILRCAGEDSEIQIVGSLHRGEALEPLLKFKAVVIDFTHHASTPTIVKTSLAHQCPLVIGTTGFSEPELHVIREASQKVPIVLAPNMSVGVNLL